MNYDYCRSCGNKIEYLASKPNFCPSCGVAREGASSVAGPKTIRRGAIARRAAREGEGIALEKDPDGTDINYVPHIEKLEYEVDTDYSGIGSKLISLGELLGTPPEAEEDPPRTVKKKRGRPRKKKMPDSATNAGDT